MHFLGARFRDVLDVQVGAVGRHAGSHRRGHARREVTTQRCGSEEHDLRLVLLDGMARALRIRAGLIVLQPTVFDDVHVIDALGNELLREPGDLGSDQHGAGGHLQFVGQLAGLAAQFQHDLTEHAVILFGIDPDFAVAVYFDHLRGESLIHHE